MSSHLIYFRTLYRKYTLNKPYKEPYQTSVEIPVLLNGEDIPQPDTIFTNRLKNVTPTPVQRHAIPVIMAGRDLMACAPCGTGRTGAFCLPIIHGVMQGSRSRSVGSIVYPVSLILCPTVERAKKVFSKFEWLCRDTGIKVRCGEDLTCFMPVEKSADVDILVATPQQILEILDVPELVRKARLALMNVKFLALDHADQMLQEFHGDILRIIKHTDMPSAGLRQTMIFGVTFPFKVQRLASDFLKSDYVFFCEGEDDSGQFGCADVRTAQGDDFGNDAYD